MSERYKTVRLDCAESTNTYAREQLPVDPQDATPTVVVTDCQTAGRGQRGNTWESEPGRNLTFSLVVYPRFIAPARQFELSMIVSVALVNVLRAYVDTPEWLKVKWPNDIYFGDRKLAGILIENSLGRSCIERSVIGIGLNVNQLEFHSDAPNPISMIHATGIEIDRAALLDKVVEGILDMLEQYESDPEPDELTWLYNSMLWRRDGEPHLWREADGTEIEATLTRVDDDGTLVLTPTAEGSDLEDAVRHEQPRRYLFKEVFPVL